MVVVTRGCDDEREDGMGNPRDVFKGMCISELDGCAWNWTMRRGG